MEWALATRFQPDRDFVVASAFRTIPLDPSLASHGSLGAKAGYDLTMPMGSQKKLEAEIPAPPHYQGARFASVEAALADGPKYFESLMTAMGSDDGREIVRELDDLRRSGRLKRETAEGRYSLAV
jgi:3-polyprenyl-4-hydroxybenzoate decarboxylase